MTSVDLRKHSICMMVFVMHGCGACDEYLPRLQLHATPLLRAGFPILIYMADDQRPEVQALMNVYNVQHTPTTVLVRLSAGRPSGSPMIVASAIEDDEIVQMLAVAQQHFVPV